MIPQLQRKEIKTNRLTVSYFEEGNPANPLLVLVHGNTSSNVFYLPNIEELAKEFHVIAPDLRGYGHTEQLPIDATSGVRVWSEDLRSFFEALALKQKPHLLGWSMGGGIILQYALDYASDVASLLLLNPLSPFGYSGTKDMIGTPNNAYYSGTGAGTVNKDFAAALRDRITDPANPSAAPAVLKLYFAPDYKLDPEWEKVYLESMFEMGSGDDYYPGNFVECPEWPFVAPGDKGIANSMSPKYVNLSGIVQLPEKPPVLWLRGAKDAIVSDTCLLDIGYLGSIGVVPGWPGNEAFPAHAMVSQTRAVLNEYAKHGGSFKEHVFEHAGHGLQVECPEEFNQVVSAFIKQVQ